jgi:N-glycosylase/DNA lyase
MQQNLAHLYGSTIQIDNSPVPVYPTPAELAQTTEEELRPLKLGYRSRYIAETATDIYANLNQFTNIRTKESVTDAQSDLKSYLGVGEKVADCVLLYSLEFTQIIPIDTWMKKAGEQLYNWKNQSKKQIQSNFKNLWSPYGGLAQLYLFTYIQQNDIV